MTREKILFNPDSWYQNLIGIASLPVNERYNALVKLHSVTTGDYLMAIRGMTDDQAAENSSDGRTRALVVGHVLGWEEWQLQVFDSKDKLTKLRSQMAFKDYTDPDSNKVFDFRSVDDFNAYQSNKYSSWEWKAIQTRAISTALRLQSFFPDEPNPNWTKFLESTPKHNWRVTPEKSITIPRGWYLWMVSLEHEAVEHRSDLLI